MMRKAAACLLAGVAFAFTNGMVLAATSNIFSTGAGRSDTPSLSASLHLQRFGEQHDPLRVLLQETAGKRAALVVLDMTSLFGHTILAVRRVVRGNAGIAPDDVLVIASHTFSAPHIFPPSAYLEGPDKAEDVTRGERFASALNAAVQRANADAVKSLRPATVGFGSAFAKIDVSRNVETARARWLGASDAGPSDKSVQTLRFDHMAHNSVAGLANYAVQSSITDQVAVDGHDTAITADPAGAAMDHVEQQLGEGAVCLFLIGAAGDQVPSFTARQHLLDGQGADRVRGSGAYPLIALQGERMGEAVLAAEPPHSSSLADVDLDVQNRSVDLANQERPRDLAQLEPTRAYQYQFSGHSPASYAILAIGDVAIVGVQVKRSASTGVWIKDHSPITHTLVVTMVNGTAKYLPHSESDRRFAYEAMNSSYVPGSVEVMANSVVASLQQMHGARPGGRCHGR
ncbi:hypothetical protein [Novosphingobium terrae]|uniref:hypothetical protein n=1 Tax=Novosphingobium terrae TaxID=2726189 RepID=UPI00197E8004|nr:hypothetical protein [Novosphingobium terrae]